MATIANRINQNQVAPKKEKEITYDANGKQVNLSVDTVRNYLVSGNKDRVTNQEVVMFINLCKFSGLNPWLKEAYCIKYGNEPATMVVGKEAFQKRAENHPAFDGCESGIITFDPNDGNIEYRKGGFKLPDESIVGGWAEVYRKDKTHSTRIEVAFDEYAGRKADGTLNAQWAKKPATMIRKVALVQALREAFPNSFGGMYAAEEQGVVEPEFTVVADAEIIDAPVEAPEIQPEPVNEAPSAQDALFG